MRRRRVLLAVAAAIGLGAIAPSVAQAGGGNVKVMTRNIYLGGDIGRPVDAAQGLTGPAALIALGNATFTLRAIVDRTDFPARAKLLAREIEREEPDLIGLQEVALWRSGPLQLNAVGISNATTVDYDFLAILLSELRARGERYEAVSVQEESDVEGPAFTGNPLTGVGFDPATARDVRLTMRDVILRRRDHDVRVIDSGSGQYNTRFSVSVGGASFAFIRGFNWADVKAGGERFRFINTHLESESSLLAQAQAAELLQGVAGDRTQPVVIACDCNSDPLNGTTKPTDPIPTPHWAAYRLLTGAGGFTDTWLTLRHAGPGFTSGFNEFVDDPDTTAIDHRIDLILARGDGIRVKKGTIVGVDPRNRTPDGLWPSDHAGVVMKLKIDD